MTLLVGSIFHMTRKIVSEMTYNVSMGTLNPTILYYLRTILYINNYNNINNNNMTAAINMTRVTTWVPSIGK